MENKHTRSVSLIDGHTEEMTDAEVIKALECCRDCKCKDCPCYNKETDGCKELDEQDILDLINRQQAEIERLKLLLAQEEKSTISLTKKIYKEAKSEAIKEFWKRFDKVLCENIGPSKRAYWKISSDGNNLVKEMTEVRLNDRR